MANKRYLKAQPLTVVHQAIRIYQLYYNLVETINIANSELICVINLQPSRHSDIYKIKIKYKVSDKAPKAWLISPDLKKYEGKLPHHTYGKDDYGHYQLCVYYPKDKNWNQQMFIADSFIPWICTWLNAYEYWLITGEWHYEEAFPRENQKKKWEIK